ncbi:MAG: HEPN domain-containing protein [Eubacterium sp.]|nr:HEPN domain-containing protein [Eubacterium sp.]
MDENYYDSLVTVRFERAKELYCEAVELVNMDSYKSANNRAFYAIEKCIKALLATRQIDVETHNGAVSQFNLLFIHQEDTFFTRNDYQKIAKADRIRSASDYDDFYIVNKDETKELLEFVKDFLEKTEKYIQKTI